MSFMVFSTSLVQNLYQGLEPFSLAKPWKSIKLQTSKMPECEPSPQHLHCPAGLGCGAHNRMLWTYTSYSPPREDCLMVGGATSPRDPSNRSISKDTNNYPLVKIGRTHGHNLGIQGCHTVNPRSGNHRSGATVRVEVGKGEVPGRSGPCARAAPPAPRTTPSAAPRPSTCRCSA